MKGKEQGGVTREQALSRAFRDSILDASEGELKEALEQEGHNRKELVRRGRAVIDRALAQIRDHAQAAGQTPFELKDLHKGLGICIQMLRRKKQLSEEELAERARVSVAEVRRIEFDPTFTPRPRTLYQLENFFKLKPRSLGVLSGAIRAQGEGEAFREGVRRFAALSSGMGKLTREEKRLLAEFFKLLDSHTE